MKSPAEHARDECDNWTGGLCLWDYNPCLVKQGNKCEFFRRNVLPLGSRETRLEYERITRDK